MPLIKFTPATIKALTSFIEVLDRHRFGAVIFLALAVLSGIVVTAPYLPLLLA